jgi:hypothetical protein
VVNIVEDVTRARSRVTALADMLHEMYRCVDVDRVASIADTDVVQQTVLND